MESGGDIRGAIEVVIAVNSEGSLVLRSKSRSRLRTVGHRSYAISGRHFRVYPECLGKSEDDTSKQGMTGLKG